MGRFFYQDLTSYNKTDMRTKFSNFYYREGDHDKLFLPRWLDDPTVPIYDDAQMFGRLPHSPPDQLCVDLWRGFPIEKHVIQDAERAQRGCRMFLDHIDLVCNHDQQVAQYVVSFFAHMIQKPWERPGTALVWGRRWPGVGITSLFQIMENVMATDGLFWHPLSTSIDNTDRDLTGHFTSAIKHKLLIGVQVMSNKLRKNAELVAELITRPLVDIRCKYRPVHTQRDISRFWFKLWEDGTFPMLPDDQVTVAIKCNHKPRDHRYYKTLHEDRENQDCLRALFDYLKSYDISGWSPAERPLTDFYRQLSSI
jgi:hypothetical protein